jgi:hypothetical protein
MNHHPLCLMSDKKTIDVCICDRLQEGCRMIQRARYVCTCADHRYNDSDFVPGQMRACLRCHDIFVCERDGSVTVYYPPPQAIYEKWKARNQT